MKLLFILSLIVSSYSYGDFCEKRSASLSAKIKQDSLKQSQLINKIREADFVVIGEAHGASYISSYGKITKELRPNLSCAFVEIPSDVAKFQLEQFVLGEPQKFFANEEAKRYINLYKYLLKKQVKIIPIDHPYYFYNRPGKIDIKPQDWMKEREDHMLQRINENISDCSSSMLIIGKAHLTNYSHSVTNSLGKILKNSGAILLDLPSYRNLETPYCSYTENLLFKKNTLISTEGLSGFDYILEGEGSLWTDFNYIYSYDYGL